MEAWPSVFCVALPGRLHVVSGHRPPPRPALCRSLRSSFAADSSSRFFCMPVALAVCKGCISARCPHTPQSSAWWCRAQRPRTCVSCDPARVSAGATRCISATCPVSSLCVWTVSSPDAGTMGSEKPGRPSRCVWRPGHMTGGVVPGPGMLRAINTSEADLRDRIPGRYCHSSANPLPLCVAAGPGKRGHAHNACARLPLPRRAPASNLPISAGGLVCGQACVPTVPSLTRGTRGYFARPLLFFPCALARSYLPHRRCAFLPAPSLVQTTRPSRPRLHSLLALSTLFSLFSFLFSTFSNLLILISTHPPPPHRHAILPPHHRRGRRHRHQCRPPHGPPVAAAQLSRVHPLLPLGLCLRPARRPQPALPVHPQHQLQHVRRPVVGVFRRLLSVPAHDFGLDPAPLRLPRHLHDRPRRARRRLPALLALGRQALLWRLLRQHVCRRRRPVDARDRRRPLLVHLRAPALLRDPPQPGPGHPGRGLLCGAAAGLARVLCAHRRHCAGLAQRTVGVLGRGRLRGPADRALLSGAHARDHRRRHGRARGRDRRQRPGPAAQAAQPLPGYLVAVLLRRRPGRCRQLLYQVLRGGRSVGSGEL